VWRDRGLLSDPQLPSMTLPVPPGTSKHASWTAARASASGYTLRGGGGRTVPSASMSMTACAPHSGLAARAAHRGQQHKRLQGRVLQPGRGQAVPKLISRVHGMSLVRRHGLRRDICSTGCRPHAFTTLQETEKAHDMCQSCFAPAAPGKSGAVECR